MKKVVITGGSGDIAKAIASELEGSCEVYLPTRKELNVTDLDQINEYISKIKPDILINNAGAIKIQGIKENDMATQKNIIDVNLTGVFACTGAALQNNPSAKIINIGSSAGTTARADWSSYCATKAAVIMATKCWADEGVDTVCISPGRTMTQMRASMYPDEDKTTLMTPEDFAKVVVRAINGDYEKGSNLDVNVNNVEELINA